jgi:hypothetical protein
VVGSHQQTLSENLDRLGRLSIPGVDLGEIDIHFGISRGFSEGYLA